MIELRIKHYLLTDMPWDQSYEYLKATLILNGFDLTKPIETRDDFHNDELVYRQYNS